MKNEMEKGKNSRKSMKPQNIIKSRRMIQAVCCIGAGVVLFVAAEFLDESGNSVETGRLFRNPCGKGDAVYEFYVDGLDHGTDTKVTVLVPEQKLTAEEFSEQVPKVVEVLCERILGENESLSEVRSDLDLVREVPEYGVLVTWESEMPEVVSALGVVDAYGLGATEDVVEGVVGGGEPEKGILVYLQATLNNGIAEEVVEIPVTVFPPVETMEERFLALVEESVLLNPENAEVILPEEIDGQKLSYHVPGESSNPALLFLGVVAAFCLILKEKSDLEAERKSRESSLMEDYPDLVSKFLILAGAGYSVKTAWKKLASDYQKSGKTGFHPLYEEMRMAVNQMETGMPETKAYADFGRRCSLRCYVKFASLLETGVNTGGRQLRALLEGEMEDAMKQRTDIAKRKGEELSSKLLLPMFGMLGVVMVMVVAPAFLSFG